MVREGKANPPCSKELSERLKEDRISELPDSLIVHILSYLPTKEAVKTSVLSTRWRSLWLWLPSLDLRSWKFLDINDFVSFGDRFFDSSRVSCLQKLELTLNERASSVDDASCYTSWIGAAFKRKIQHLLFYGCREKFLKMPQRLYSCETLVSLKLSEVSLEDAEFVCLPCLKTMHLECIDFPKETTFETLVLCCPLLENLKVVVARDDAKAFRVHSQSLKWLYFKRSFPFLFDSAGVVINAPRLCYLYINDTASRSFILENLNSNAKLHISLLSFGHRVGEEGVSSMRSSIRSFVPGLSMVRDMIISGYTFKLICQDPELELMPRFGYMSRLRISLPMSVLEWIPTFLESCPNLKSLILVRDDHSYPGDYRSDTNNKTSFESVPECLLWSLEYVSFIGYAHYADIEKLVNYFLKNSAILKKLTAPCSHESTDIDYFNKIPRRSSKCRIVI